MRAGRPRSQEMPSRPCGGGGVSGGRLLRKPTRALWETPVCPPAGPPPWCADHSRKNGRSLVKTNHQWTRIDTKTDGPPSTTSVAKMLLHFCALGVTMSWDDGLLGARASRPHQAWHSLGHLPHLDQPGTAPWLSFGLRDLLMPDAETKPREHHFVTWASFRNALPFPNHSQAADCQSSSGNGIMGSTCQDNRRFHPPPGAKRRT